MFVCVKYGDNFRVKSIKVPPLFKYTNKLAGTTGVKIRIRNNYPISLMQ